MGRYPTSPEAWARHRSNTRFNRQIVAMDRSQESPHRAVDIIGARYVSWYPHGWRV